MLLGVDVGTTGVKALLFNPIKKNQYFAFKRCDLIFPGPDQVEQDPQQIWEATKQVIREVVKKAGKQSEVTSISISSQGGTLIPLGKNDEPLSNAIVWMDHRAKDETNRLKKKFGNSFFYSKTGWRLFNCLPFLQIYWLRRNRLNQFEKIKKFTFVGDYIAYKLSEAWVIDPSSSAITMLFNLNKGCWDEEILEIAGISEDQLPIIFESGEAVGYVSSSIKEELEMANSEILLLNGGHDQYCASLGAGAINEGDLLLSGGTAWVLLLTLNNPIFDTENYLSPGRHVIGDKWGLLSSIPAGGSGVNWFKNFRSSVIENRIDDRKFYNILEQKGHRIAPGCDGLFFFPHFVGTGAPTWENNLKATIFGLDLHHDPAYLFRALLEGVGFEVIWNINTFEQLGLKVNSVSMIGGATKSLIWPQIISDMLNIKLKIPKIQEAACVGAAILAGLGAKVFHNYDDGVKEIVSDVSYVRPNKYAAKEYRTLFQLYKKIFWKIREAFKDSFITSKSNYSPDNMTLYDESKRC
jgi:xylulokinase